MRCSYRTWVQVYRPNVSPTTFRSGEGLRHRDAEAQGGERRPAEISREGRYRRAARYLGGQPGMSSSYGRHGLRTLMTLMLKCQGPNNGEASVTASEATVETSSARIPLKHGLNGKSVGRLYPFHIIFDKDCNIMQAGPVPFFFPWPSTTPRLKRADVRMNAGAAKDHPFGCGRCHGTVLLHQGARGDLLSQLQGHLQPAKDLAFHSCARVR